MNKTSLALIQRNFFIHLLFLRKPMYIYILAGLLTFAFLYLPACAVVFYRNFSSAIYSCGDSSGFPPDSLFIRLSAEPE